MRADIPASTPAQIAARYRVGVRVVLDWIATGQLKAMNVSRSPRAKRPTWRISQAAIDAFEAARTPAAPPTRRSRPRQPEVIKFYG